MFFLKNDDMDDLFRKAAENYSVDTSRAADWERVSQALQQKEDAPQQPEQKEKKKKKLFAWWFLLLPGAWIAHNAITGIYEPGVQTPAPSNEFAQKLPAKPVSENKQTPYKEGAGAYAGPGNGDSVKGGRGESDQFQKQPPESDGKGLKSPDPAASTKENGTLFPSGKRERKVGDGKKTGTIPLREEPKVEGKSALSFNHAKSLTQANRKKGGEASATTAPSAKMELVSKQPVFEVYEEKLLVLTGNRTNGFSELPFMQKVGEAGPTPFPDFYVPKKLVIQPAVPAPVTPLKTVNPEKAGEKKQVKQSGLYVVGLGAADFTTVRFQKITGIGHGAGLMIGYQFNKRWAVEAGALWEQKQYYTKGDYVDKSKMGYLASHEIYWLDGDCKMVTLPWRIRYNLSVHERSKWFATAGMASYLMNKEQYDVSYDYYGQDRERNYTYYNAPKSWFATISLNAGYEYSFWKKFNIRVEPYLRLPASKVGTGRLSLQSAGLFLGVGKRF